MSEFSSLFRREFRAQSGALWTTTGVLLLMPFVLGLCGDAPGLDGFRRPWFCAFVGSVAAVLTIAPGLLGGELSGDGLRLLQRLPTGPGAVLRAKLGFLVSSAVLAAILGLALGLLFAAGPWFPGTEPASWASVVLLTAAPLLALGWPLLASLCVPSTAVGLPCAGLLAVLCAGPVWWLESGATTPSGRYATEIYATWFAVLPWPAVVLSWCGPLGRYGDRTGGLKRAAISVLVLAFPAYWHATRDVRAMLTFDLAGDDDVVIRSVLLGADTNRAFANVYSPAAAALFACEIDLATGAWRRVGDAESMYVPAEELSADYVLGLHGIGRCGVVGLIGAKDRVAKSDVHDALSQRVLGRLQSPWPERTARSFAAEIEARTPLRDRDGRPVFVQGGTVSRRRKDGSLESITVPGERIRAVPGPGGECLVFVRIFAGESRPSQPAYFLPRTFSFVPAPPRATSRCVLLDDAWLYVANPDRSASRPDRWSRPAPPTWRRAAFDDARSHSFDAAVQDRVEDDDGRTVAAAGLSATDEVASVVDGRFVLVRRANGAVLVVDPKDGATSPVLDESGRPVDCQELGARAFAGLPVRRTTAGDILFSIRREGVVRLCVFRERGRLLSTALGASADAADPIGRMSDLIAPLLVDGDRAIVLEGGRRIVAVRFGSDEREVLFPRAASR